jgi:hypothetical protein
MKRQADMPQHELKELAAKLATGRAKLVVVDGVFIALS